MLINHGIWVNRIHKQIRNHCKLSKIIILHHSENFATQIEKQFIAWTKKNERFWLSL